MSALRQLAFADIAWAVRETRGVLQPWEIDALLALASSLAAQSSAVAADRQEERPVIRIHDLNRRGS